MENYIFVSFICALFGVIVVINETKNIRRISSINIINLFGYMYGVTYGFLPACVLIMYVVKDVDLSHGYYRIDYSAVGLTQMCIWVFFGIVGYLSVQISYNLFYSRRFKSMRRELHEKDFQHFSNLPYKNQRRMFGKLQGAMLLCFVISVVSLFLWTRAYGGIWGLIKIADKVRDGVSAVQNSIAFFMRPAKMILMVVYMSLVLVRNKYRTGFNMIFLIVSFVLSVLMLLGLDGRMGTAIFFVTVVLLAKECLKVGNFSWRKIRTLIIIGVIALIGILNMDMITFYIRNGYWENTMQTSSAFEVLLLEFSYIITGAQHAVAQWLGGDCPYLIGHDILAGIFAWIPSSIRPDGIINIWNYNTEMCTIGGEIYGQLPCDFITTSVYTLGGLGPLVFGIFWGCIIKVLDYCHLKDCNPISDIFYCAIAMRIIRLVNYCLLYDFVLGLFSIILAFIIWWVCKHVRLTVS